MTKFNLTNKQIQLIHLSYYFIETFKLEKNDIYKDVDKLYGTIDKLSNTYTDSYSEQLQYAHKQLMKLTEGKEFDCNPLVLALGFIQVFAGTVDIDKPILNKLFGFSNKIYKNIEKVLSKDNGFSNANNIVKMFTQTIGDIK